MEHSTLYDEKRTLVEKVIALTEKCEKQDSVLTQVVACVNRAVAISDDVSLKWLADRINNLVLDNEINHEQDQGITG